MHGAWKKCGWFTHFLFKIETITLEKAKGVSKLEEALGIIEGVMKEKKGTFKVINKYTNVKIILIIIIMQKLRNTWK